MKTFVILSLSFFVYWSCFAQDVETPKLPSLKKANSGQVRWMPDTIITFLTKDGKENKMNHKIIYKYNSQGLLQEKRDDGIYYFIGNDPWKYSSSIRSYSYDSNNNLLTELQQNTGLRDNIEIISWVNNNQVTYTYDSNNNLLTRLNQNWGNNSWVNSYQVTHTYDTNNNLLTVTGQKWEADSWTNDYQFTYTYDSNNNMLTYLYERNGEFFLSETYTYDSNNNLVTRTQRNSENIIWIGNDTWVSDCQYTYTYDANNNLQNELIKVWWNNSWIIDNQYIYTYDSNNNLLNELFQGWWNNSWVNASSVTRTYDSNNNMLSELHQRWIYGDSLVNVFKYLFTYDENGNGTSVELYLWLWESWQSINDNYNVKLYYNQMQSFFEIREGCNKIIASYIKVSDNTTGMTPPAAQESNAISIYPNPTRGELKIMNYELGIKSIRIYDTSGFNVFCTKQTSLDISYLPAGLYFVKITTEKGVVTKKVVKR